METNDIWKVSWYICVGNNLRRLKIDGEKGKIVVDFFRQWSFFEIYRRNMSFYDPLVNLYKEHFVGLDVEGVKRKR